MKKVTSLLGILIAMSLSTANAEPLAVDTKAPDFALNDSAGAAQSLSDYLATGPVALVFYRSGDW